MIISLTKVYDYHFVAWLRMFWVDVSVFVSVGKA